MEDNRLDLLFVFDNKGFHGDVVVFMVLPQRDAEDTESSN